MIRKASMLKAIAVFVAVLGLSLGLSRQAAAQEHEDWIKPITKQGSAAIVFGIEGLGKFNIQGPGMIGVPVPASLGSWPATRVNMASLSGVGGKFFIVDEMALRIALGFSHMSGKLHDTDARTPAFPDSSSTAWGIGVGVEKHFRPLFSSSPYVGLQVMFASSSTDEPTDENETYSGHNLGVQVFGGFDWFVTHGLAIGAEGGLTWQTWGLTSTGKTDERKGPLGSSIEILMNGLVHVVAFF